MPRRTVLVCLILLLSAGPPVSAQSRLDTSFEGIFVNMFPEKVGDRIATVKWELRCVRSSDCILQFGNTTERWDKLGSLSDSILAQARGALKYAKDHRERAAELSPTLRPLLESTADISTCIDLGYTKPPIGLDFPGYIILCTVQPNPWNKPAVLLMGSAVAGCGPAFCRYEIMPLFKTDAKEAQ